MSRERVAVTYNMNVLQRLQTRTPLLVTLNLGDRIDPSRIILRLSYEHPIYTPAALAAQARQAEINGADRAYFCGAYWRFGFHEDGVVSALDALAHFRGEQDAQRALHRTGLGIGASRRAGTSSAIGCSWSTSTWTS